MKIYIVTTLFFFVVVKYSQVEGGDTIAIQFNKDLVKTVKARNNDIINIILVDIENGAGLDYSNNPPDPDADRHPVKAVICGVKNILPNPSYLLIEKIFYLLYIWIRKMHP